MQRHKQHGAATVSRPFAISDRNKSLKVTRITQTFSEDMLMMSNFSCCFASRSCQNVTQYVEEFPYNRKSQESRDASNCDKLLVMTLL